MRKEGRKEQTRCITHSFTHTHDLLYRSIYKAAEGKLSYHGASRSVNVDIIHSFIHYFLSIAEAEFFVNYSSIRWPHVTRYNCLKIMNSLQAMFKHFTDEVGSMPACLPICIVLERKRAAMPS